MKHAKVRTIALDYLGTQTYKSPNFISSYILPVESKHKVWCNPDRQLLY
jgi:hypothetical protein